MTLKQSIISFVLSVSFLIVIGCGTSDPRTKGLVPAFGVLLYNGDPVGGASIVFHHEDNTRQGGGATTNADGSFTLRTYFSEGTYPGTYQVTVLKDEIISPMLSEEEANRLIQAGRELPPVETRSLLPQKYRLKTTTDLQVVIPPGGDRNLIVELSD